MKKELETLLKTPISGVTYGGSYITSNPKLLGGRGGRCVRRRDAAEGQLV